MTQPSSLASPDASTVLTKALLRASERLGLSQAALARTIGVSEATASRVARGRSVIDPTTKEGELALMLLRAFRSLDALVGGDAEATRAWMRAENDHLRGVPAARVQTVEGLADVVAYLDALRARL